MNIIDYNGNRRSTGRGERVQHHVPAHGAPSKMVFENGLGGWGGNIPRWKRCSTLSTPPDFPVGKTLSEQSFIDWKGPLAMVIFTGGLQFPVSPIATTALLCFILTPWPMCLDYIASALRKFRK